MQSRRPLIIALLAAAALKLILILTASVPFNSDEAVVGLMASHILEGERPLFFYGQSYMGSLDAFFIAAGFRIFGAQIWVIRLVQSILYLAFIYTTWLLARRFFKDPRIADMTALVMAVPPVLVTTYTTATLGGYGEILLLGNLILLLGYEVVFGKWQRLAWAWIGLGFAGGVGFWTLGMAGVYLLPVGLAGLLHFRRKNVPFYAIAAGAFFLGSLPWWLENFSSDWGALGVLTGDSELRLGPTTPASRAIGLFFLGLPSLIGIRFPWTPSMAPWPVSMAGLLVFFSAVLFYFEVRRRKIVKIRKGSSLLLGVFVLGFVLVFVGTHFGVDSTGRYLLPMYFPLVLGIGGGAAWIMKQRAAAGWIFLGLVLLVNGTETWRAARYPDKITTQFDPITSFDNQYDGALIRFLEEQGETVGYSNYWVTFRLAFLTNEEIIFSPRLPYKSDLRYTPNDNRYPQYDELVAQSDRVAYITTKHPELDGYIRAAFDSNGISYAEKQIGAYHIFYDLSQPLSPEALSLPGKTH